MPWRNYTHSDTLGPNLGGKSHLGSYKEIAGRLANREAWFDDGPDECDSLKGREQHEFLSLKVPESVKGLRQLQQRGGGKLMIRGQLGCHPCLSGDSSPPLRYEMFPETLSHTLCRIEGPS